MDEKRPSWDEYFMTVVIATAARSSCLKFHSGAVIVKDKRILSSGYNGNPSGTTSCNEQGFCNKEKANINHLIKGSGYCLAAHGETNAILQGGIEKTKNATMYSLLFPCNECAKLIINSGIKEVIYLLDYKEPISKTEEMFNSAGIKIRKIFLQESRINDFIKRVFNQESLKF
ncbi:MAG: dCMP deaminase family protein [archaeon]